MTLLPDKKHRLETKIKRRTLNPRWNETFYFEGKVHTLCQVSILYSSEGLAERTLDLGIFWGVRNLVLQRTNDLSSWFKISTLGKFKVLNYTATARRKILHNFMCNEHNIIQNLILWDPHNVLELRDLICKWIQFSLALARNISGMSIKYWKCWVKCIIPLSEFVSSTTIFKL